MDDRPNVLLIMSDQHSPHVIARSGDGVARTPTLDALAGRGVSFTSAYCPAPLCVPSRMSFLTARYPSDQRVWSNSCVLNSSVPTFAHGLSVAGYETVLCGRMHFVGHDQRHGFEKRLVGDVTPQLPGTPGPELGPKLRGTTGQDRPAVVTAGPGRTAYQAYDLDVTRGAQEFLRKRSDARPFCMVVGFVLPHCPFVCPKELYAEYYEKVELPQIPEGYFGNVHPFVNQWRRNRGVEDLTDEQIRRARAAYYGLVTFTDERTGEILDALDEAGISGNTVVIYTSDHGEMAGEHGMWWKSNLYEGSSRVPLIVSWPGNCAEGRVVPQVTSLLDIGPTLLAIAGAGPLPFARGRSLLRFLRPGEIDASDWPDETFSEHYGGRGDRPSRMIRSGPWKLNHYHGHDAPQLFNLEDDPGEWNDLASDPSHERVRDELRAKVLDGWDADLIERELARQSDDVKLLVKWGRAVGPECPDHWETPPGANVFPEE